MLDLFQSLFVATLTVSCIRMQNWITQYISFIFSCYRTLRLCRPNPSHSSCRQSTAPTMTLNHSKTWPVNTVAVVQLRVDPHGRTYSTLTDHTNIPFEEEPEGEVENIVKSPHQREKNVSEEEDVGVVLPLSRKHLEMFTRMSAPSFRTTVRTDTVSTTLEQDTDVDCDNLEDGGEDKLFYG